VLNVTEPAQKILVIEDDEDFRYILLKVLTNAGYRTVSAPSGEEGLSAYGKESPDLVVLDVQLPDMMGTDICRKIRSQGPKPQTPILLCTIRSALVSVSEGLAAGATDYILKPFSPDDLLDRVRRALG